MGAALKYLGGYSLNTTDEGELDEAKDLVRSTRDRLNAAFNTDSRPTSCSPGGETVIGHSTDRLAGIPATCSPSSSRPTTPTTTLYFVPREGGTRWIDNMRSGTTQTPAPSLTRRASPDAAAASCSRT